jgi:hypothetical protein
MLTHQESVSLILGFPIGMTEQNFGAIFNNKIAVEVDLQLTARLHFAFDGNRGAQDVESETTSARVDRKSIFALNLFLKNEESKRPGTGTLRGVNHIRPECAIGDDPETAFLPRSVFAEIDGVGSRNDFCRWQFVQCVDKRLIECAHLTPSGD